MINGLTVGLVIPAHNEETGLTVVLNKVPSSVDRVFVVANCCTDRTEKVARELGAIVVNQPVKGYGSAYKAGFNAIDTDIVCTADADGTYPVDRIPEMVSFLLIKELDFVSARRIPNDKSVSLNNVLRYSGNTVLTLALMILFFVKLLDSQSGMWIFRRQILNKLALTSNGMAFSEELKIEAWRNKSIRCSEYSIPFSYLDRMGQPKLNLWRDGFRNMVFLFAKRLGISMTGA